MKRFFTTSTKRKKIQPMTMSVGLETCALLAKQLNKYTPMLSAIGDEGNRVLKREMISVLATSLLTNESDLTDVKKIVSNLLGKTIDNFVLGSLADDVKEAWAVNNMPRLFSLCHELGIYTRKDLANMTWVLVNWTYDNGRSDRDSVR